jgi:SAM-dependent methyltransferase
MLAAARTKAAKAHLDVQFIQADMRSFDFPERFSTILIPGNSLLHLLTAEDLKQCLFSVRRNLATGGRLAFDISKWDLGVIGREAGIRYPVLTLRHPTRGIVTVEESAHYNAATQIRHVTWYLSAHGAPDYSVTHYDLRVIFPEELLLLLDIAGLRLEARYGEFSRVSFDEASPRQVCVATI